MYNFGIWAGITFAPYTTNLFNAAPPYGEATTSSYGSTTSVFEPYQKVPQSGNLRVVFGDGETFDLDSGNNDTLDFDYLSTAVIGWNCLFHFLTHHF